MMMQLQGNRAVQLAFDDLCLQSSACLLRLHSAEHSCASKVVLTSMRGLSTRLNFSAASLDTVQVHKVDSCTLGSGTSHA